MLPNAQPKPKPKLLSKRAEKAAKHTTWRKVRAVVLERDKHQCRACGQKHGLDVHHVVMRSLGGSDDESNLLALCRDCHASVHGHVLVLRPIDMSNPQKHVSMEWVK